ncbi:hypothetical protein Pmani_011998 [Petrolisthes manimaculis]|uniref:Uncharacterized protein n=1 Tax=Petrolisthes manimaculis TaxID=1843537 RepID=A0AAE1UAX4_9EUCA|nr:hypothetical protein Pmani_011998 [Petrolisthes manimaculis]
MAPNVRVRDTWETESDETSHEDVPFVAVPSSVPPSPPLMSQLPELFLPHLPQHSLDPDSPNLHLLQRHRSSTIKPQVRSQSARSTLKVLQELEAEKSQRPLSIEERNPLGPIPETSLPEASTRAPKELPPLSTQSPLSPESLVQVTNEPTVVSAGGSRRPEITPRRRPTVRTSTWPPPTTTTHTTHRRDPGVLKLPGHEPEAPADLVLIHHDRAIDTHNQTGLNGIFVRDDSTSLTAEGNVK